MGTIVLFVCLTLGFAFFSGILFTEIIECEYDHSTTLWFMIALFGLALNIGLTIAAIQDYYMKKEYPTAKYNIKKKVIVTNIITKENNEEYNTIKLDTVYTFKHK